ncbi:MAG: nitroreductase family protein [Chloroflexi bacterium]|nr:nitroreductase family protein [Chloroflexota bacterium]
MIEAIHKRKSVRTYTDQPIEKEKREKILDLFQQNQYGPFGNEVRFKLIDLDTMQQKEVKTLGTYGIINGAKLYIVSAVKESAKTMVDVGYCFEKIILSAANLGLGTCWMGGTFKRASFSKQINVSDDEVVPIVSPIGYAHKKRTLRDKAIRRMAKGDTRKPWQDLFFNSDMNSSLSNDAAGEYSSVLECVRLGPSATNFQPWRIIKESEKDIFHLYLKRTKGYNKAPNVADLQMIDMGIAMCHFELAAQESGIAGKWENQRPSKDMGNVEYIVSWMPF